jgi:general secretion pathway protein B
MSYILDALRKADAQRERDSSRGIHAHPTPLGSSGAGKAWRGSWLWAAAAVVIAIGGALAWSMSGNKVEPAPLPVSPVVRAVQPAAPVVVASRPAPEITPPPPPPRVEAPPVVQPTVVVGLPVDAPRVAISGGVYSPNPAQRMLIVGGQVLNEGSEIAPGLVIDEIKPRTAVLKFRGARYTVAY